MIETDTSDARLLPQRINIAASPDWQNLLMYFDLAGEGFAFIVLLVPDSEWAEACRQALGRYLMAYHKQLLALQFKDPEEFSDELASRLLSLEAGQDIGVVWVEAAIPEVSREYEKWEAAWRTAAARLNQYRNPLRRRFNVPLLFVGAPWVQVTLREMAPDLWSIRTLVVRIEPTASDAGIATRDTSLQPQTTILGEGRAIDPDFALKQAESLRGQPGKEMALSRLLHRAGRGFIARFRWDEAEQALTDAIELYRRFGAETEELAGLLLERADIFQWKSSYEQAVAILLEALRLFQQSGDVLGEANCIKGLGDIAYRRSHYEEAQARYEQALPLFRQIGEVLGEANCIKNLGDIALRHSQYEEARARYEQALPLYKQVGEVIGEANCIARLGQMATMHSQYDEAQIYHKQALQLYQQTGNILGEATSIANLGEIALRRAEYDEAHERYEQALPIFQRIGSVSGEANCITLLGDIAYRRSHYEEAQARYEQALLLYKKIGDVLGEANCIHGLGEIALAKEDKDSAKQMFTIALHLYERIPDPYPIGSAHRRLARLVEDEAERQMHIQAARDAWESIGFTNLVKKLDEEFGVLH